MRKVFLGMLFFVCLVSKAQNNPKEVLFTIDDKPYYTDEFERVYKKNLDLVKDESQKDLNQYLELFVGYKLKVNKANKLGLQDNQKYQNELKSYRTQLAKNYTTDSKVTEELVKEGYDRMKKEINASHILIKCDENASAEDTLAAYKKALDIRERLLNGDDFGKLAQEFSDDPSAKENKGNLGFFTSFRMVYAFESAAYKTPKGQISNPVRTRFGYHILKINDVRDNRGEVSVAHIMLLNPKEGEEKEKPEDKIQDIYKKLQQGESFEELAKQFSEDKSSAQKGGVLSRFGSGQLSSTAFEDVAFSLTKENPISKPFQSEFGWHIVKLIDKFPVKTFDEMKSELESKISKDDRSRIITNSLTDKLRKKYTIKKDAKVYASVVKAVTNDFYESKWEMPTNTAAFDKTLFSFEAKKVTATDFLNYINAQQKSNIGIKPLTKLVDLLYQRYVDEQINQYYNDNLEKEFPEFSYVMDEYRDGLLLFDLMEKEIWDRAKTDTLGLQSFYNDLKTKPTWKKRADVVIVSSTNMDVMKKALAMIKKGKSAQEIKDKLNTKDVVNVMVSQKMLEEGSDEIPSTTKFETGISDITKKGDYYFVTQINKTIPAGDKTLDECKGKIVNEYQQYLEQNWVNELKKEFNVKVNQDVFQKVKQKINN
jgi:peptidyl-prolyl cis-trans isomerase SurA